MGHWVGMFFNQYLVTNSPFPNSQIKSLRAVLICAYFNVIASLAIQQDFLSGYHDCFTLSIWPSIDAFDRKSVSLHFSVNYCPI